MKSIKRTLAISLITLFTTLITTTSCEKEEVQELLLILNFTHSDYDIFEATNVFVQGILVDGELQSVDFDLRSIRNGETREIPLIVETSSNSVDLIATVYGVGSNISKTLEVNDLKSGDIINWDMAEPTANVISTSQNNDDDDDQSSPTDIEGVYEMSWQCAGGSSVADPGLTAYILDEDGTYIYISGMYDLDLKEASSSCPQFSSYYVYNQTGYRGDWTSDGNSVSFDDGTTLEFSDGDLIPQSGYETNSCGDQIIFRSKSTTIGLDWGDCYYSFDY